MNYLVFPSNVHIILIAQLGVLSHEHATSSPPPTLLFSPPAHLLLLMMAGCLRCTLQNCNPALCHHGFDHVPLLIWAMLFKLLWLTIPKICCMISIFSLAYQASSKPVSLMHLSFILSFLFLTFSHLSCGTKMEYLGIMACGFHSGTHSCYSQNCFTFTGFLL